MKLRLLTTLVALAFSGSLLAQTAPAAKPAGAAPAPAASSAGDKNTLPYAFGYQLGAELARSGETVDMAQVQRGLSEAYAKKAPAYTVQQMQTSYEGFQKRMQAKMDAEYKKALAENQSKSPAFLAEYKAKPGIVTLPSGVMYRVVEPGAGAKPTANSQVTIAFQSVLPAVGVPVANSQGPTNPFKVSDSPISGLKEILPLMPTNAVFEVAFPAGKAVTGPGSEKLAGQAILMQVKLLSVK